jgi:hypothetical protein
MTGAIDSTQDEEKTRSVWRRRLTPSFQDFLFASLFIWLFVAGASGWEALLADGDAGWHIRTGEYVLDSGAVPRQDLFSFSKEGQPWFAWEWLADVLFALVWRWAGMKGLVLLAGTVISLAAILLFRNMLRRGAGGLEALLVLLFGVGASSIHFLARPHIFTLLLLPVTMLLLERDRERNSALVWLLVPLTALWTNLHGGFLAGILTTGLLAAGCALARQWRDAMRYGALAGACGAASLVNPYGYQLHAHIAAYMRSDWIRSVVDEFQSPNFRGESMLQFEVLLLAGILCVPLLASRRNWPEALWILAWAHLALGSVRHVPIYVIVAAPVVAAEATALWRGFAGACSRKSVAGVLFQLGTEVSAGFRRATAWMAVPVLVLLLPGVPMKWPADFPAAKFPVAMVNLYGAVLRSGRVLTMDQWADYLLYRFYPQQRVFHDGRSDFFGPELGKDYLMLMNAGFDSEKLLARHNFSVVMCPVTWPLATMLKRHSGWRLVADDGQAILFVRRTIQDSDLTSSKSEHLSPVIAKKISPGLMKRTDGVERPRGDP